MSMSGGVECWTRDSELSTQAGSDRAWYAVHTYPRHEKAVAERMQRQGMTVFLPMLSEMHRWSDRRKFVQLPLFSCYVFVQMPPRNEDRIRVLRTDGVISLVGMRGQGTPIPEEQIEAVRTVLAQGLTCGAHPFLKAGQRVRIRGGALDGVEGVFLSQNGDRTLVVSVDAIQRSLAVRIDGYEVDVI
jgi:transcription antitermination factor NusG